MKTYIAYLSKEFTEIKRTGKLTVLVILSVLFGIMNPAIAKITPWMMETMADSLEETGLTVTAVTVDAMTSWTQFYKNIPIVLIVFVLMFSGAFTAEYQKGTLIPVLTKGLSRFKVVMAKGTSLMFSWTVCYWICFGITFAYNAYFWDNSIVSYPILSAVLYWIFGIFVISLMVLFSTLAKNSSTVLLGTGGSVLLIYILGLFRVTKKYVPTKLMNSMSVITGIETVSEYIIPICITILLTVLCYMLSISLFNKKML